MNRKHIILNLTGLLVGSVVTALAVLPVIKTPLQAPALVAQAQTATPQSPRSNPAPAPSRSNMMRRSDEHFIVMMIPHHEDAVAMADLALDKAKHPEIKKLAEAIKRDQTREIQQMQTWYKQWYGSEVPAWSPGMGRGMGMMPGRRNQAQGNQFASGWGAGMGCGMAAGADLSMLQTAPDFDRTFIEQMIPHHQMAVMMTHMIWNSQRPEMRSLANAITKTQTAEINQMQRWYRQWYQ